MAEIILKPIGTVEQAEIPRQPKIEFKCPQCGWVYSPDDVPGYDGLVPTHVDGFSVCAGEGQNPRGLADRRPLWGANNGQRSGERGGYQRDSQSK